MNTLSEAVVLNLLEGQAAFFEMVDENGRVQHEVTVIPIWGSKSGRVVRLLVQSEKPGGVTVAGGSLP